jgi:hypothetical protein
VLLASLASVMSRLRVGREPEKSSPPAFDGSNAAAHRFSQRWCVAPQLASKAAAVGATLRASASALAAVLPTVRRTRIVDVDLGGMVSEENVAVGMVLVTSSLSGLVPTKASNEVAGRMLLVAGSVPTDNTPVTPDVVLVVY